MRKHLLLLLAIVAIITGSSCKKTYNCKCITNGTIITDYYEDFKKHDDAMTWCDDQETRMNNGNNPQKDTTYCSMLRQKQ